MNNSFIILAAGKSKRFNSKIPKPYYNYKQKMLILHSIDKALLSKKFSNVIVAINKSHKKFYSKIKKKGVKFVAGSNIRAKSAFNCLKYLKNKNVTNVLIHDAARPNFSYKLINDLLKNLRNNDGVIPVIKTNNSVKIKENNKIKNLNRNKIYLSQTPQGFKFKTLFKLQKNINKNTTDDASLLIENNKKIKLITGEQKNLKITTKKDLNSENKIFFGIGFDVHKLVPKKKLYLGGLLVKSKLGTLGHSDGDPVLHAIIDSILGACKMGDIGQKFSNKNKKFKNIRSTILLQKVMDEIKLKNYYINNIDINIITQHPKISKYKNKIKETISKICEISKDKINIKGKTTEKLGVIGKEKAIACEVISSVINYV